MTLYGNRSLHLLRDRHVEGIEMLLVAKADNRDREDAEFEREQRQYRKQTKQFRQQRRDREWKRSD